MVEIKNVTKRFGEKVALNDVSLSLPNKGLVLVKGHNGSGKTTLVNLVSTLDSPNEGSIIIDGVDITKKDEKELSKFREQNISIIFQKNNLIENLSVEENINIVGGNERFGEIIKLLQIEELLKKRAKDLSGGEQQKVAIARAILKNAKIVIADEPTSSIDIETREVILNTLKTLSKDRLVILIAHENDYINDYADKVVELSHGEVTSVNDKIKLRGEQTGNVIIPSYKNRYKSNAFAISSIKSNMKGFIRNSILIIFSMLFVFVVSSIASINYKELHADTMKLENSDTFIFSKRHQITNVENGYTEEDIKHLKEVTGGKIIYGKGIRDLEGDTFTFNVVDRDDVSATNMISYSFILDNELEVLEYGKKSTMQNEIVISSYIADFMIKFGIMASDDTYYKPKDYQQIINDRKEIKLGDKVVIVSGIYLVDLVGFPKDSTLGYVSRDMAGNIYVKEDFFDLFKDSKYALSHDYFFTFATDEDIKKNGSYGSVGIVDVFNGNVTLTDGTELDNLNSGEVIVAYDCLKALNLNKDNYLGQTISIYVRASIKEISRLNLKIVGLSLDGNIYFNKDDVKDFLDESISINRVILKEKDKSKIDKIVKSFPRIDNDAEYSIKTDYSLPIDDLRKTLEVALVIFPVIAGGLILLTCISMFTYILNSINNQKNDIALLKSLGVSNKEISKSLFIEELILVITSFVTAVLFFLVGRIVINLVMSSMYSFKLNITPIRPIYMTVILIVLIIFSYIVNLLTFNKIKKTKPELLFKNMSV